MIETSIDGGAESDHFVSVPGTPTTENDAFLTSESVYDHLVF